MTATQSNAIGAFIRSLDVATKIALPFLLGGAGWVGTQLWAHEGRLIHIESTQFTSQDAQHTVFPLTQAIDGLNKTLSELRTSDAVTRSQLTNIEANLTVLKADIKGLERSGNGGGL